MPGSGRRSSWTIRRGFTRSERAPVGAALVFLVALQLAQGAQAQVPDAADIAEGMRLFLQKGNCQACHGWACLPNSVLPATILSHTISPLSVDRDDPAVRQVGDHEVFPERDAARARNVARVLDARIGDPDELAAVGIARVDLVDGAPAVGRVHETVVDQRIDLVFRA